MIAALRQKLTIIYYFVLARWLLSLKSAKKVRKIQNRGIARHFHYLKKHSPHFATAPVITSIADLSQLPVTDKQTMMAQFNHTNTLGLDRDTALKIAIQSERDRNFRPTYQGVSVGLSSGTSGHRGLFVISPQEQAAWTGTVLAKFLPRGQLLVPHRIAFFLRANNNLYESVGSKRIEFRYFDVYQDMNHHIAQLRDYQPTILVAPPSVLTVIAESIESGQLRLQPQKVIAVAEVLTEFDKENFRRVFQQDLIFQAYQCTEGFLAYTCEAGSLHLNEEFVYVEKSFIDDSRFVPILTDFTRKTQPIIRYRLNDILVLGRQACPCGSATTVLDRIEGREDDVFLFARADGSTIKVFPDVIGRCIVLTEGIKQYRVIQTTPSTVEVHVQPRAPKTEAAITAEFHRISTQLDFLPVKLSFHDYQPDLSRKLKRIERKATVDGSAITTTDTSY